MAESTEPTMPPQDELEIFPSDLQKILESDSKAIRLIDCREEDEFAHCRIEGAELIPLSRFTELALPLLKDEEKPLVVYCHHGMRSLQATQFLRQKGVEKTWSLNGGIERWSTEIDSDIPRY